MVFSAPSFLFLVLPLALISIFFSSKRFFCAAIVFWSFLFYYWGSEADIYILLFSATFNFLAGFSAKNRFFLFFAIFVNLLILFAYKYSFFIFSSLPGFEEGAFLKDLKELRLPTGISFFTFQAVSYLVDVYKRDCEPAKNPVNFFAYLSFFPQLIAGPIVRYQDVADDLVKPKKSLDNVSRGMSRFAHGLLKKVVIADTAGEIADFVFALSPDSLSTPLAWIGVFAYSSQIYFDFSGYSDMAIGIGQILGIRIKENFSRPYSASTITEFWRRWHMSLSLWFRDYLYIPLGGNRRGPYRTIFNLSAVFILCGLWHGAEVTFLVWGIFHGSLLGAERVLNNTAFFKEQGNNLSSVKNILFRFIYFIPLTLISWTLFRAESMQQFFVFFESMFLDIFSFSREGAQVSSISSFSEISSLSPEVLAWNSFRLEFGRAELLILFLSALTFVLPRHWSYYEFFEKNDSKAMQQVRGIYGIGAIILASTAALTLSYSSFLYFRF